jgi:hypothetical protein
MIPVLMLHHRHDPDPEMRQEPIGAEQHEKSSSTWRLALQGRTVISGSEGCPTWAPAPAVSQRQAQD